MNTTIERRFAASPVQLRGGTAGAKGKSVRGYAAMFGKRSSNLGSETRPMFEIIQPGAFDGVLKNDVRALFNHDANLILARSKAGKGTLLIGVDATGLWYEFALPDTSAGRDLAESLSRGDIDQSSFSFTVAADGQKFEEQREGDRIVTVRTLTKLSSLYDVSPVTNPAYPDATVALRSLEGARAAGDVSGLSMILAQTSPETREAYLRIICGARS